MAESNAQITDDFVHSEDHGTLTVQRGFTVSGRIIRDPKSEKAGTGENVTTL